MMKKLILAAVLALCAFGAQATCTLTTFRSYVDGGNQPSFIPLPPTACVNALNLSASSAKADTPPAGANRVILSASCAVYYVRTDGTAAVIAGDVTDGSASLINWTQLHIVGVTSISVIAPTACQVSLAYFK